MLRRAAPVSNQYRAPQKSMKLLLGMCTYMDGKHESLIQFQSEFPDFVNQYAKERDIPLECRLIRLVGCDEMSRKKDLHSNFPIFDIGQTIDYDAIFDRIGTVVPTAGIYQDRAIYSGTQIFNRPVSIDESKARDYMIADMRGFSVPRTVILPQGSYVRAKMVSNNGIGFDINFDEAVERVGGYPCFLKKASGGGKVHVYRVKNKAELFEAYQLTREHLMVLQEGVEMDLYIRTFCFGNRVIHTCYDIDKPDGQKYRWPSSDFTEGDRYYLDRVIPALAQELLTPYCTMEIAKSQKDGKWYFIDITNGCNFDMREGELTTPIYRIARQVLMEELVDWTINPKPIIVHSHLQEYVVKKQICRAHLKGQNPEHLLTFAQRNGFDVRSKEFENEIAQFAANYRQIYGD